MSDEEKKLPKDSAENTEPIPDETLEKVTGGKCIGDTAKEANRPDFFVDNIF